VNSSQRIDQLLKLLESEPDDCFLRYALALEYMKGDALEEAIKQFDVIFRTDPNYAPAYFACGRALVQQGKVIEAREKYEAGIPIAEKSGDAHLAGQMREALELLDQ
jgi:Tfp pilus assembly protein PilF